MRVVLKPKFSFLPSNKKTLSKPVVMTIHLILVSLGSGVVYYAAQQHEQQLQQQRLEIFSKQATTLIDRHSQFWLEKSQLLAQQPMLNSTATLKAVIPVGGTVPPSMNYADQDLLNRTKEKATFPEISGSNEKATVSTALIMPTGGYAVFEWPATALIQDLKAITPTDFDIKLSQQYTGAAAVEILRLNSAGNDGLLQPIPLKAQGWKLEVADITPQQNLPLWLALISFFTGLIPLCAWFLLKNNNISNSSVRTSQDERWIDQHSDNNTTPDLPAINSMVFDLPVPTDGDPLQHNLITDQQAPPPPPHASSIAPVFQKDEERPAEQEVKEEKASIDFILDDALFPDAILNAPTSTFPNQLFRAYDIRGLVEDLSSELVTKIARGLAATIRAKDQYQVVVGYDSRTSSTGYAKLVRQALGDSGLTVIDIGMVPTPVMHFAAKKHDSNGIMITASHNPADENGLKWVIAGQSPSPEDIQVLKTRIIEENFTEGFGSIIEQDYKQDYLNWLHEDIILAEPFNIAFDGMNGSMGELALSAFKSLGCAVSSINTEPNGMFPNGAPDPSKAENLQELSNDILISGSQIGFAFDGDGDRLAVLNSRGEVISPDYMIALFAKMVLDSHPGSDIVFDVKCSRLVSNTISNAGGRPIMVRTGNTFLRTALRNPEHQVVFAGEFASHYFFNDERAQGQDDALYAALRLLEWLDQQGQTIDDAVAALPVRFATEDTYLPLQGIDAQQLMIELEVDAHQLNNTKLSLIDGIRLDFDRGFGIIRPSNTGANLTVRFDADSADDLQLIRSTFAQLLSKHDERLAKLILE
jgi:phosphomannomutase/phosphoglucomutase